MKNKYKKIGEEIFALAGIQVNGSNPWDIQILNEDFFERAITGGELGVGESYMDAWWNVKNLDEFMYRILRAQLNEKIQRKYLILLQLFTVRLFYLGSRRKAFHIGEKHYDLGNDLFQHMLDKRMNYSCAYWKNATTLDEAQENKLDLICRKLLLKPGMRILDIGCGWGAFGKFAAEKYQAEVVGLTVSKEQVELGQKLCEGLPVEFRLKDYREIHEKFDRVVSVGMFEHVGHRNYRTFFEVSHRCLVDEGLFLLHTIGRIRPFKTIDAWTHKYIFPNAMLPSAAQIGHSIENLFVMEDWHNMGSDYDKTLMAWHRNFVQNWDQIKSHYSERFFRMWNYYLLTCAASFRSRHNQVWQIVLSPAGVIGGYPSVR